MIKVRFKKLDEAATLPKYAHVGDIGMDVKCISITYDAKHDMYIYHTGLACETKQGVGLFLFPRSSNCKTSCYLTNSVGVVDSATYRGEIQARYKNRTSLRTRAELIALRLWAKMPWYEKIFSNYSDIYDKVYQELVSNALDFAPYKIGDKCVQIVPMNIDESSTKFVNKLKETDRGEGGFGSTGK